MDLSLTKDGFLLQKTDIHTRDIQRIVNWKDLGVCKETLTTAVKLKYSGLDEKSNFIDLRPKVSDFTRQTDIDFHYITELCMPYNPPPDERDLFLYFSNMAALSGRGGYARIRDGYVYSTVTTVRS